MTTPPSQFEQQPNYYQPQGPGPQQPATGSGLNGMGLASLIIGVVGLAVSWIPWIGFAGIFIGIVGLVFGILGLALAKYRGRRLLAIIGTIVSGLALLLSMILPFLTGFWWTWSILDDSGTIDEFETLIEEEFETYIYEDEESDPEGTGSDDLSSQPPILTAPEETPAP